MGRDGASGVGTVRKKYNYGEKSNKYFVEVIPLGHAETGAETMVNESGMVRLELVNEKGDQTENE